MIRGAAIPGLPSTTKGRSDDSGLGRSAGSLREAFQHGRATSRELVVNSLGRTALASPLVHSRSTRCERSFGDRGAIQGIRSILIHPDPLILRVCLAEGRTRDVAY